MIKNNYLNKTIYCGILILVFIYPLYLFRFSVFGIPTTFLEIFLYFLFLLFILNIFLQNPPSLIKENIFKFISKNKIISFILLLFITTPLISTITSDNLNVSAGLFKAYFIDTFLFLILLISTIKKEKIQNLLNSFILSSFFISLISVMYFILGKTTYDNRLEAFFNSPNFLAMTLAPSMIIIFWKFIYSKITLKMLSLFLIILIPFLLTYSFGAFIGTFTSLIYIFISFYNFKLAKYFYITIFIFSLIFLFIILKENTILKNLTTKDASSFQSRIMIWNSSDKILKDNYLLGIGPGNFQDKYLKKQAEIKTPYLEWAVPYPHNIFLAFWIQNGLLGFVAFLSLILLPLKNLIYKTQNNKYHILVSSFLIYTMIHGLVDTPYWKNDLALIFFMFIGIFIITDNQNTPKQKTTSNK